MPGEDARVIYGYPRKGHGHASITAEEAVGIGILTVILGILLLLACWYCRRRSGYKTLKDRRFHAGTQGALLGKHPHEKLAHQDTKLPFQEHNCGHVVPSAPPAYEKLSAEQSPPPYSP